MPTKVYIVMRESIFNWAIGATGLSDANMYVPLLGETNEDLIVTAAQKYNGQLTNTKGKVVFPLKMYSSSAH